jgi:chaperonin GroES
LPGSAQEKPNQGEVVAVGSGRILDNGDARPVDVKVGDNVVFGQYAGNDKIDVDGEELIILSENDIKAVLEG